MKKATKKSQSATMRVRSKEEIRQSMIEKGIIDTNGTVNEKAMTDNAVKSTIENKEILKKTSKSKTKKAKAKKSVLVLEGVDNFTEKTEKFDTAMKSFYGDKYNADRGTVLTGKKDGKPFYVNVQVQEMKIRSDKTENTSGLRVYMFKNASSYTIGEYAGKISIDRIAKRIQIIADAEMSR